MSELQNPLFDEEKEFLERKKLEYERALRGDVEHIKERSMAVGKVAAVGAGLVGGIWLIAKAFGGKKRKRNRAEDDGRYDDDQYDADQDYQQDGPDGYFGEGDDEPDADGSSADYYTAGNGKRYKSRRVPHGTINSASTLARPHEDVGHKGNAAPVTVSRSSAQAPSSARAAPFDAASIEDDPFQDLPYDDSRRLPVSHAFDGDAQPASPAPARPNVLGTMLQTFLKSETGKMVLAQAAALALAAVTKKTSEFFPAAKNSDIAGSPGPVPDAPAAFSVASPAPSVSSDASTHPQSI